MEPRFTIPDQPRKPIMFISGSVRSSVIRFFQRSGIETIEASGASLTCADGTNFHLPHDYSNAVLIDHGGLNRADVLYIESPEVDSVALIQLGFAAGRWIPIVFNAKVQDIPAYMWILGATKGNPLLAAQYAWERYMTPIEQSMYRLLQHLEEWKNVPGRKRPVPVHVLYPQWPIGPWRADFFMTPNLIVECDGVTYHSNPEKVIRDKQRDRWFTERGFKVLRFSTPEIQGSPERCLNQVSRTLKVS